MRLTVKHKVFGEKHVSSSTLSATNSTQNLLGSSRACEERNNRPSSGKAVDGMRGNHMNHGIAVRAVNLTLSHYDNCNVAHFVAVISTVVT
jgi:hypothetical protein